MLNAAQMATKKLVVFALLATYSPLLAQTPETIELGSGTRGIAINGTTPDSDFARFSRVYKLQCFNGCWVLAVNGRRFETDKDWQRTRSYHDDPLLHALRTPSARSFQLQVVDSNIRENVISVYEVYFDKWDARVLTSHNGVYFVPNYFRPHQLIRVSPDLLIKQVRSSSRDLPSARDAAARSEALYPSPPRVAAVRAALGEVIVKEVSRRIEQAELADSQNDWSQASSILKGMLSEIPESRAQVASLVQSYYEHGTQAEAQENWEAAVSAFNKTLDVFPEHQQAQIHKNAVREKAVKECLSKAQGFELRKNYQAGLALLDRYTAYFPDDERLGAAHERLAEASAREQAHLAAAAAEHKLQNQIDACTQQLNGHLYAEAARSVSDLVSNDLPDSRIRSLVARAAQEIPPQSYESHAQAEKVIWYVQRLTPASALASPEAGVRIDWHGNFEAKTIDNWYVVRSSHGQFVFKGSPATVAFSPNKAVRVIGTIQGVERIGTLGGQPQQMVVVHVERID